MTATESNVEPATNATGARLRFGIFDKRAEDMGATSEAAKAELIGVDRVTLWRWRKGHLTPSLDTAMTIAKRLDLPLGELVTQEAA